MSLLKDYYCNADNYEARIYRSGSNNMSAMDLNALKQWNANVEKADAEKLLAKARAEWPLFTAFEKSIAAYMTANPRKDLGAEVELRRAYEYVMGVQQPGTTAALKFKGEPFSIPLSYQKKESPVFYDVAFTVSVFKRQPDDSQLKVQKTLGNVTGVQASTDMQAIAIAARKLKIEVSDEELAVAEISFRKF